MPSPEGRSLVGGFSGPRTGVGKGRDRFMSGGGTNKKTAEFDSRVEQLLSLGRSEL